MHMLKAVKRCPLRFAACITTVLGCTISFQRGFSEPVTDPGVAPQFFSTKINVSDLQRSTDFYTKVMGLTYIGRVNIKPEIAEVLLSPNGKALNQLLILYFDKNRKEPLNEEASFNNMVFAYADLNKFIQRFKAAGYTLTSGSGEARPSPVAFAKSVVIATAKDPDGFNLELIQFNE
jgi:catechol 2,3-dioxygenase-like lactoylglutathione lyase family enzyme